jgi:hypothetical protein
MSVLVVKVKGSVEAKRVANETPAEWAAKAGHASAEGFECVATWTSPWDTSVAGWAKRAGSHGQRNRSWHPPMHPPIDLFGPLIVVGPLTVDQWNEWKTREEDQHPPEPTLSVAERRKVRGHLKKKLAFLPVAEGDAHFGSGPMDEEGADPDTFAELEQEPYDYSDVDTADEHATERDPADVGAHT